MQEVPIQTRWAKEVLPTNVLPEYPRPQMQRKDNWQNLNGLWDYIITDKDAVIPNHFDRRILVPNPIESALSGLKESLDPTQNLWYRKEINITFVLKNEVMLLHFGR